jgi:tripartite-type tricarboxylate transporter receptor subunit TctC
MDGRRSSDVRALAAKDGLDRRTVLAIVTAALLASETGWAQQRQISVVVPFPAGGSLDAVGRIVTQAIAERSGLSFVVENKAGANGSIAARAAAQGQPDGPTWLVGHDALVTVNPALYGKQGSFDPVTELKVVRGLAQSPSILVAHPGFGPKTLAEFIDFGRRNEIVYASGGLGSAGHLTMEQLGRACGLKLRHVPYRGGAPAVTDLIAGQVSAAFLAIGGAMAHVEADKLRALAVSSLQRISQLPQLPTVAESGYPDFESVEMFFVFVGSQTSASQITDIAKQLALVMGDEAVRGKIRTLGVEPISMPAQEAEAWLAKAREAKTRLISEIGIKPQ